MFLGFWGNWKTSNAKFHKSQVECTGSTIWQNDNFWINTYLEDEDNSKDVNTYDSEMDNDDRTGSLPSVNSWGDFNKNNIIQTDQ